MCTLVATNALKHAAWAEHAAVMLDEETEAFFKARLGAGAGLPPSKSKKKRKQRDSPLPEIPLRVASLDGSTLTITAPQRGSYATSSAPLARPVGWRRG